MVPCDARSPFLHDDTAYFRTSRLNGGSPLGTEAPVRNRARIIRSSSLAAMAGSEWGSLVAAGRCAIVMINQKLGSNQNLNKL